MALCGASAAFADDNPTPVEQKVAPSAFNEEEPEPVLQWGVGRGRSYWVPAADILLFDLALNQFNRRYIEPQEDYASDWESFEDNLTGSWVFDEDSFDINQIGHPYQGALYHGFARSAGHGYWTSLVYTFFGSALWELAGETTPPSINDQFTTGIGGTLLGEPLYRMASLLLESGDGRPSGWRVFASSFLAPGWNRTVFGDRFDGVFRSHDPAVYTRAQVGVNLTADLDSNVNANPDPNTPPVPQSYERGEAAVDFTMVYGLPGKAGYTYHRPFDYFHFQMTAASGNLLENLMTRGLLIGVPYGDGERYRGIVGIYGSYDYIAPQIFRVSNTAIGPGTTTQWWLSRTTALQGEFVTGLGYGSGGVTGDNGSGERDYHYGMTPQALLSLRLIFNDNAAFEVAARDYYITDTGSDADNGAENIARGELGLTFRVRGLHGITLKYTVSHRNAHYAALPDTEQTVSAVSVGYTYIGHRWFGAVDWRPNPAARTGEEE